MAEENTAKPDEEAQAIAISRMPEQTDSKKENTEDEAEEQKEAADQLTVTFIDEKKKCLDKGSPFYPMLEAARSGGEFYAYCLVDSKSYNLSGKGDFRTFIESVRYIGKGKDGRCLQHPFEETKAVDKIWICREMWENEAKLTAVCLTFYETKRALQVEALMLAAFGVSRPQSKPRRDLHRQLWNTKQEKYKGEPALKDAEIKELGVQLLYTAWEVYVNRPVVLEMILSHPNSDARRIGRIVDKEFGILEAAKEICDEASKLCRSASDRYRAATDRCDQAVSLANKVSNRILDLWTPCIAKMNLEPELATLWQEVEKKCTEQKEVQDKMKDSKGGTSANDVDDLLDVPPEKENMLPKLKQITELWDEKLQDVSSKKEAMSAAQEALDFAKDRVKSTDEKKLKLDELFSHT